MLSGCSSTSTDKTPQTEMGKLNSCMLNEIYERHAHNSLPNDEWTAALEVFDACRRQLNIDENKTSRTRSLNIAVSVINSLQTTPSLTEKK